MVLTDAVPRCLFSFLRLSDFKNGQGENGMKLKFMQRMERFP